MRACDVCGERYQAKRPSSRYCSARCRNRKARQGLPDAEVVRLDVEGAVSSVAAATRAELAAAGRLETSLGQAAMAAAIRLDASRAVQGYAAMLKEYRDTMREAMADVEAKADTADELREAALRLISGG